MRDILNQSMVLVLNRNWQAINIRTPQEAFCMMATHVATGLDIEFEVADAEPRTPNSATPTTSPSGNCSSRRCRDGVIRLETRAKTAQGRRIGAERLPGLTGKYLGSPEGAAGQNNHVVLLT